MSIAFDYFTGASIILIPLIILIFIIGRDLDLKEKKLNEEIHELEELFAMTKSGIGEVDEERIKNKFQQIRSKYNDHADKYENIYDFDYGLPIEKLMKIRKEEIVVLHEKKVTFQKGSIVFIALLFVLLSLLPLIHIFS